MLVIDGKNQKSLKIQELNKEWKKEETLYVDSKEGLNFLDGISMYRPIAESTIKIVNDVFGVYVSDEVFKNITRIVLYLNIDFSGLKTIKEFENELKKYNKDFIECVVTVQSEEDEIGIYNI